MRLHRAGAVQLALPEEARFINQLLDKGGVNRLINTIYRMVGDDKTIKMVDAIKDIGFKFATISGTTLPLLI